MKNLEILDIRVGRNFIKDQLPKAAQDFLLEDVQIFKQYLEDCSTKLSSLDFDLHEIYRSVAERSEKIAKQGDSICLQLKKSTSKILKQLFRYAIMPYIKDSFFVNRGLLKPHGFPGDFEIVEAMYDGNPRSLGLGYIYDIIFLESQLCQGLRNRKEYMKHILDNFIKNNITAKDLTIFNVGCGGSRELRETKFKDRGKGLNLYLMDFDPKAIDYSFKHLLPHVPKAKINLLNSDVRALYSESEQIDVEKCDLIYSIGLFDYLPDKVLKKLLTKLLRLLDENGLLIFAHKDYTFYNPLIADWFCDWKYYPRSQKDIKDMLRDINITADKTHFNREKDGYIYFISITK